jgi:hypothetical protein
MPSFTTRQFSSLKETPMMMENNFQPSWKRSACVQSSMAGCQIYLSHPAIHRSRRTSFSTMGKLNTRRCKLTPTWVMAPGWIRTVTWSTKKRVTWGWSLLSKSKNR